MFYWFARDILKVFFTIFMPIKAIGKENVPKEGAFVLAMNHKSMLDVIAAGVSCPRTIYFMAKKELFKNKFVGWILKKLNAFPVDREKGDLKAIKMALGILKNEHVLGIFPEGKRVHEDEDVSAKAGVSMLALRAKTPVVPAAMVGEYGIFKRVYVVFGAPISLEKYYDTKPNGQQLLRISGEIMGQIKKIGDDSKKRLANGEKLR